MGVELTEPMYVQLFLVEARGAWHLVETKGFPSAKLAALKERRNRRCERSCPPRTERSAPEAFTYRSPRWAAGYAPCPSAVERLANHAKPDP